MNSPQDTSETSGKPDTFHGRVLGRLQKEKVYMDRNVTMELQDDPRWGQCIVYTAKPSKVNGHLLVMREAYDTTREEEIFIDGQFVNGFSESSGGISSWGDQLSIDSLRDLGVYVDPDHPKPIHAILNHLEDLTVETFHDLGRKDKLSIKNNDPHFCEEFDRELAEVRQRLQQSMGSKN